MIQVWRESTKFNLTSLADQARKIWKKGWFSDLEILEICEQVPREENTQREPSERIETKTIENETITVYSAPTSILMHEDRGKKSQMNRIRYHS